MAIYDKLNEDIWGDGYRIVTDRAGIKTPADLTTKQKIRIARHFFQQM